ncbi:MAG: four helix bundle protein [Phycisphaerae bacterium]|nr:four helix bundle protein [Phycisphaerae bacterium]
MHSEITFQFEELIVYQKALDVIDYVYDQTKSFPKEELYGLISQFRRAAVSISLNLAEGTSRSKTDYRRFLDIAQGSVFECVALLEICKRRKFIYEEQHSHLRLSFSELSKMISGLKRSLGFPGRGQC